MREDFLPATAYRREHADFRARVLRHRAARQIWLGPHAALCFEDRLTIQYRIQKRLLAERTLPEAYLEACASLIPDGDNWKASFVLEYADPVELRAARRRLAGIERALWIQIGGHQRVAGAASEGTQRSHVLTNSVVHSVHFQLTPALVRAARTGGPIAIGIAHPGYDYSVDPVAEAVRVALVADLCDTA